MPTKLIKPNNATSNQRDITFSLYLLPADGLQQKLQRFHVPFRFGDGPAPCVEAMPAKQHTVRVRVIAQHLRHGAGQLGHILIVLQDRQPFAMPVRGHALEAFQHFKSLKREASLSRMTL